MTGKRSDPVVTILTVLLVAAVGWVDYLTGEELSVSILYLIPIYLCTWRIGHRCGLVVAWASAIAWLVADLAGSERQGHPLVPYWNGAVLLGMFWVVVHLLSALKVSQTNLEDKVAQRTAALSSEVAERRRAEDRLTQVNRELSESREKLVGALSDLQKSHADLKATQLQLIEAAKLESIGRLAAGVAHEVKNPLMTLTMVADYLAQVIPAGEPDAAPMLQDMRDAIRRANQVIGELLEFSRPSDLVLAPEDFHAIVDRALSLVKLELKRRHIDVVRGFCEALPALPMDKNKVIESAAKLIAKGTAEKPVRFTALDHKEAGAWHGIVLDANAEGSTLENVAIEFAGVTDNAALSAFLQGPLGGSVRAADYPVGGEGRIQPVPEPGTILLLGSGIAGLIGVAKRSRKR